MTLLPGSRTCHVGCGCTAVAAIDALRWLLAIAIRFVRREEGDHPQVEVGAMASRSHDYPVIVGRPYVEVTSPTAILVSRTLPILTKREVRVLELVATGLSSGEVARTLWVSAKDVEYHVSRLIRKFEAKNRTAVVSRAYVLGYLAPALWPPQARRLPANASERGSR